MDHTATGYLGHEAAMDSLSRLAHGLIEASLCLSEKYNKVHLLGMSTCADNSELTDPNISTLRTVEAPEMDCAIWLH